MSEKFCQECKQKITEGKEIKFERALEEKEHYIPGASWSSGKTIYSPARTAIYYICPECYEKIEQQIIRRAKKQDRIEWIILALCILGGLILMVLVWTRNK